MLRLALVLALIPAIAHADPPGLTPPGMMPALQQPTILPSGTHKDPTTAVLLSIGVTAGGLGMMVLAAERENQGHEDDLTAALNTGGAIAFLAGPTVGHAYAGKTWNTGLGMRIAGLGTSFVGLLVAISECAPFSDSCNSNGADAGAVIALGGLGLYAAGGIYEIATAGSAANEYNHAHGLDANVGVVPIRTVQGTTPGFALTGHF